MTVILHPNKENPMRYRVLDKELDIQTYFSFKEHGKEKAKMLADELQVSIEQRKKARRLRLELAPNKLFSENGMIRGVTIRRRQRAGVGDELYFDTQKRVAKNDDRKSNISLNNRGFDEAYGLMATRLLAMHGIEIDHEITERFEQIKPCYQDQYKQLCNEIITTQAMPDGEEDDGIASTLMQDINEFMDKRQGVIR